MQVLISMRNAKVRFAAVVACLALVSLAVAAQTPVVNKVEPPNWWAGLPENPMLLLYGSGLERAKVEVSYPGVSVDRVEPGNEGYLFVWLKMSPAVKAGTAKFEVRGEKGTTEVEFPIWKRERSECSGAEKSKGILRRADAAPQNDKRLRAWMVSLRTTKA